jgi:hypothetical protein
LFRIYLEKYIESANGLGTIKQLDTSVPGSDFCPESNSLVAAVVTVQPYRKHAIMAFFNRPTSQQVRPEPARIPTLYSHLDQFQLEQFLTDQDYAAIKTFDNVYILPFVCQGSETVQTGFGLGLSWLMIRNLMLLRDISIHGPEDTPDVPYDAIHDIIEHYPRSCLVTGIANLSEAGYSLHVEVHRPGQIQRAHIKHEYFQAFLSECSTTIAQLLGSTVVASTAKAWFVGQPRDAKSLIQLGQIKLDFHRQETAERAQAAQKLLDIDPDFSVAMWHIDEELPGATQKYLMGLKRDPYNAQLCFLAFCAVWTSQGPQPDALQFCRKAIELSPGHGKTHMCAPHAAQRPTEMLRHSELGYRLLPGNSFAVNNYTIALAACRREA